MVYSWTYRFTLINLRICTIYMYLPILRIHNHNAYIINYKLCTYIIHKHTHKWLVVKYVCVLHWHLYLIKHEKGEYILFSFSQTVDFATEGLSFDILADIPFFTSSLIIVSWNGRPYFSRLNKYLKFMLLKTTYNLCLRTFHYVTNYLWKDILVLEGKFWKT